MSKDIIEQQKKAFSIIAGVIITITFVIMVILTGGIK